MKKLFFYFLSLITLVSYPTVSFSQTSVSKVSAQTIAALPRSTPEAEGVSSDGIARFLEAAGKSKHEFHSFMFLRHGKVIAEGWWKPYRPDLKHTMYSVSKSFTATAIGFAVSEKRLSVTDKVISFFPDDLPDTVTQYLSDLTVKDLLSMSVGQQPDPTFATLSSESNWVKGFLATPIVHKPGTKFLYNTLATYTLSAIVQKVTGERIIDYLGPRLFKPLGIEGIDWEIDPKGINTGGWGLRLKTEDMARFGQLFLQNGNWKGKQILPKEWIEEATTLKIIQNPDRSQARRDSSDWDQGYCYQMWRSRHNSYRGDGAFGQFILVLPDQDAVIIITAETPSMQDELNLVWDYLLPAMHKDKLPSNEKQAANLKQKLSSLSLTIPAKSSVSTVQKDISGKIFTIEHNDTQIQSLSFLFKNSECNLIIKTDTAEYHIPFGQGIWARGETTKRGPYLVSRARANRVGLSPFKITGAYSWKDANTLELVLRYIESPHTETITCDFEQNKIVVNIQNSNEPAGKTTVLTGRLKE